MEEDSQEEAKLADEREKEVPKENGTNGEVNEPKPKETPKSKAKRNVKARTGIVMLVFFRCNHTDVSQNNFFARRG